MRKIYFPKGRKYSFSVFNDKNTWSEKDLVEREYLASSLERCIDNTIKDFDSSKIKEDSKNENDGGGLRKTKA